jgi:hypothetical protein
LDNNDVSLSVAAASYVRVKRRNQTFFIHTSPSDSFLQLKSEISLAMGGTLSPQKMRLYIEISPKSSEVGKAGDDKEMADKKSTTTKGPIPDAALLSDHDVKSDDILYVVFAKSTAGDDNVPEGDENWEEIDISQE